MTKRRSGFRYGYTEEGERTAPRSSIFAHYLDTHGWVGTTINLVVWTIVIGGFYLLVID